MLLVLVIVAYVTVPVAAQQKGGDKQDPLQELPTAEFRATEGEVHSIFDDEVVANPLPAKLQKIFNGNLVYRMESDYELNNKKLTAEYYVMIFNFNKTYTKTGKINAGEVIGTHRPDKTKVILFCKTLDPYLVLNCSQLPYKYGNYYWFNPMFLIDPDDETKWLSFHAIDSLEKEAMEIITHVENDPPGFTVYPKLRVRYKTQLNEFPRPLTEKEKKRIATYESWLYGGRTGLMAFANEISIEGRKFLVCWQNGFDKYLKAEYTLKSDIWLYGIIATYDVWEKCGYIFLRDFSLISVEQKYEERLKAIQASVQ